MHCVGSVFLKIWIDPTSHAFGFLTQLEASEKDFNPEVEWRFGHWNGSARPFLMGRWLVAIQFFGARRASVFCMLVCRCTGNLADETCVQNTKA